MDKGYKGFKSERAFYNCKLHGLAVTITSEETARDFLREEVSKVIAARPSQQDSTLVEIKCQLSTSTGITDLTDDETKAMYAKLLKVLQGMKANAKAVQQITGSTGYEMSDAQRRLIIKITKYQFRWSAEVTFSKITEIVPGLLKKMNEWQIKNSKLQVLYGLMSKVQADKVIKTLMSIEKRNKEKSA